MATNDFQVFAGGTGANVITQPTYLSLAARSTGFQSGIASSAQLNKVWRQASIIGSMIAQFIVDQTGANAIDDGTIAALEANFRLAIQSVTRVKQSGPLNLFVNAVTGSDGNNGLSNTAPFRTITAAISAMYHNFDFNGNSCTINVAGGQYVEVASFRGQPLGCVGITLLGNASNPGSVIIDGSSANVTNAIESYYGAILTVIGVTVQTSHGSGVFSNAAVITMNNIQFNFCGFAQMATTASGQLSAGPGAVFSFAAGGAYCMLCNYGGTIFVPNTNMTFLGTPSYSTAFAFSSANASIQAAGIVFSGSFNGTRYAVDYVSSIEVGGAGPNYFPGTNAGSASTGNFAIYS